MYYDTEPFTAEKLLADMWDAHYGPSYPPAATAQFWQRNLALCRRYLPAIIDPDEYNADVAAFLYLIEGMRQGKGRMVAGDDSHTPRTWFHLFYRYFNEGLITPELWGCAARTLYVISALGPGDVLPGLRDALPEHLMRPDDYGRWSHLPNMVTLYRGTCAATHDAMWQGVSWTPYPDDAAHYARWRTIERYDQGDESGWPRMVEAVVPRAAILGVVHDGREYLVDHELMDPGMVRELAAKPPAQVDAFKAPLIALAAATRADRERAGVAGALDF